MKKISPLDALITAFERLPGVGPKTAQRYVLHLLQYDKAAAEQLSSALKQAAAHIGNCLRCNTFTEQSICPTCSDEHRDPRLLAVIETPADQAALESTLAYQGFGRSLGLEEMKKINNFVKNVDIRKMVYCAHSLFTHNDMCYF